MTEIEVTSGAKVVINPADFQNAIALKNAIAAELGNSGIKLDSDLDLSSIAEMDISVLNPLINAVLNVDSSPAVNTAIFNCLEKCLYNGGKITGKTFDSVEARADYYEIIIACLKENLAPFFKGLISKFSQLKQTEENTKIQK